MTSLILGRRRQGKSTLALALAYSHSHSIIVFDPNSQFRAFPKITSARQLQERMEAQDALLAAVYRPDPGLIEDEFHVLSEHLWPKSEDAPRWENFSFIIDECSAIQSPANLHPDLERWLRLAPPDVDLIQTTHRLVDTHRLTRALSTDFFFFQTTSGHDLKLIEQELEAPDLAQAVSRLGAYECAHYTIGPAGKRLWWIWREPESWYLELGNNHGGRTANHYSGHALSYA